MRIAPLCVCAVLFGLSALAGTCDRKIPEPDPSPPAQSSTPAPDKSRVVTSEDIVVCMVFCEKLQRLGCEEGFNPACEEACLMLRAQHHETLCSDEHVRCVMRSAVPIEVRKCGGLRCVLHNASHV
jgi:hypothetical protein